MGLNQAYLFYVFLLTGLLIGLLFDVFRILRKSFKTSDFVTLLQDIIFWLLAGGLFTYTVFKFNNGEIRSYVFLGVALGFILYLLLFSKTFIKVNVKIITFLKKLFHTLFTIILTPLKLLFRLLRKVLLKPVQFIFINIRKNVKNTFYKMSKIKIRRNLFHKKEKKMT